MCLALGSDPKKKIKKLFFCDGHIVLLTHIEVAVNNSYSSFFFFSFDQRKEGKEIVSSMGSIQGSKRKLDVAFES